jgi:hypothetical protein
MPRQPIKSKWDYSLRRRLFTEIGEPMAWTDHGHGMFMSIEIIQSQIRMLASVSRKVEIEFIWNGKLCGYDGQETGTTIIYKKR